MSAAATASAWSHAGRSVLTPEPWAGVFGAPKTERYRLDLRRAGRTVLDVKIRSFYFQSRDEAAEVAAEWALSLPLAPRGSEVVLYALDGRGLNGQTQLFRSVGEGTAIPEYSHREYGMPWFVYLHQGEIHRCAASDLTWAQLVGMSDSAREVALAELARQFDCSMERALEIVFEDELAEALAHIGVG